MTDVISHSVTILFVVFILGVVVYGIYTTFKEKKETSRLSKVDAWEGKEFREEFEVIGISKDCGNIKLRLPEVSTSTPMPAVKPPKSTSESVSSPTPSYPTGDKEVSSDRSIEVFRDSMWPSRVVEEDIPINSEISKEFKALLSKVDKSKVTQKDLDYVKEEIKRMEDWK